MPKGYKGGCFFTYMCRLTEKWEEEIQKKDSEVEDANTAESAAAGDDTVKTIRDQ